MCTVGTAWLVLVRVLGMLKGFLQLHFVFCSSASVDAAVKLGDGGGISTSVGHAVFKMHLASTRCVDFTLERHLA